MNSNRRSVAVFQPIISVEDDIIDIDWFDSYIWHVDQDGEQVFPDDSDTALDEALGFGEGKPDLSPADRLRHLADWIDAHPKSEETRTVTHVPYGRVGQSGAR